MTQPSFVPIGEADQVRPSLRLEVPRAWTTDRPAELVVPVRPGGRRKGMPGPDQGFALRLARRFEDRLHLVDGESAEDVMVGCALIAARRSATFGRAPSIHDLRAAFSLWGFLGPAPAELVTERRHAFRSAAHEYPVQRALVDRVADDALRLTPEEVSSQVNAGNWRALVGAEATSGEAVVTGGQPTG